MWSEVSCRCWGLPEEILGDLSFGRVCGFFLVCSMPGSVEIQSGSNRDPVGVQSGSSRGQKFNWKRNHVEFFERNEFTTGRSPAGQQKRIPDWITTGKRGTSAGGSLVRGEVGGRKLDLGRKKPGGAWQKAALRPERCEKGWCSRSSCA